MNRHTTIVEHRRLYLTSQNVRRDGQNGVSDEVVSPFKRMKITHKLGKNHCISSLNYLTLPVLILCWVVTPRGASLTL